MNDIYMSVFALLDGGWTSDDKYDLMYEYGLTEDEATQICNLLFVYEGEEM